MALRWLRNISLKKISLKTHHGTMPSNYHIIAIARERSNRSQQRTRDPRANASEKSRYHLSEISHRGRRYEATKQQTSDPVLAACERPIVG